MMEKKNQTNTMLSSNQTYRKNMVVGKGRGAAYVGQVILNKKV